MSLPLPDLRFFKPQEFVRPADANGQPEAWSARMQPRLLVLLDTFRFMWGKAVDVSPAPGALGRYWGQSDSQHNIAKWGEVRAVDVMTEGLKTADDFQRAIDLARSIGFTGVGIYPDWSPSPGLHLDVRVDREPGDPALWGALSIAGKQHYFGVAHVLAAVSEGGN